MRNVQNWEVHCLQTEEESGQQRPIRWISRNCQNLFREHLRIPRLAHRPPVAYANRIRNSDNIVFDNMHIFSQTRLPFDNACLEEGSGVYSRRQLHASGGQQAMKKAARCRCRRPSPRTPNSSNWPPASKMLPVSRPTRRAGSLPPPDPMPQYFPLERCAKKADVFGTVSYQPQVIGFAQTLHAVGRGLCRGRRQVGAIGSVNSSADQALAESATQTRHRPLLPVGIHNRMDIMQDYMQHRGWVIAGGQHTADHQRDSQRAPRLLLSPQLQRRPYGRRHRPAIMQAFPDDRRGTRQEFYMTSEDDCRTWTATLDKDFKLSAKLFPDPGATPSRPMPTATFTSPTATFLSTTRAAGRSARWKHRSGPRPGLRRP